MSDVVICRGGRTCETPATHATLVRHPTPIPVDEGWEPLCWSHAINHALMAGSATARYTLTLCSIGYAIEDEKRPLVRYAMLSTGKQGYEVLS